jgi:hypothetical protein
MDELHPTHIGGELIYVRELVLFENVITFILLPKVSDHELVCRRGTELGFLEVDSTNPEAFVLQTFDEVPADETAGAANECPLERGLRLSHSQVPLPLSRLCEN